MRGRPDVAPAPEVQACLMTKPIVVAVDPRREDVAPAALGALLARTLEAPLVVATACPVDNIYPEYAHALRRNADRAVERIGAAVDGSVAELRTTSVETDGSPARALHRLAVREQARVLVIGSSERGPVGRVFPSAVTDRLLHGAPCPVAVAPTAFEGERLETVGVAFTDAPDGRTALDFATGLAAAAHARLRVFSVAEPPDPLAAVSIDALGLDYVRRAHEDAARTALERGLGAVPDGLSAGGETLSGDPAAALATASKQVDLLVCGARGHGPVRTVLLGGTSHALVRMASCPVLVVPLGTRLEERENADALEPQIRR